MRDGICDLLNLGAGIQSSTLLLMSCQGILPKLDAAIFADTQWEPQAVYRHLRWLVSVAEAAGIPVYQATAGDLRQDAIDFRRLLASADGKRWASMPLFIKNPDGSQGRVKRQCTKEYKIEVCERIIKQQFLGLKPRQRSPKVVRVRSWFGISSDETQRACAPGRWIKTPCHIQGGLYGVVTVMKNKRWVPTLWKQHVYPLLDLVYSPDRKSFSAGLLPRTMSREHCKDWLHANYPGREFPRSACVGCPFRTNQEWRLMRDEDPEGWADAVAFDHEIRVADKSDTRAKVRLVGLPFVHRQLIPLDMVDLDGAGERTGGGCGSLYGEEDGSCGL